MKKKYFRNIPDFDYVSRLPDSKYISDYVQTKNLFKRVKMSEEIFGDLTFFDKFIVENNERPDLVAYKVYDQANLDWLVLLSNNIINWESEWPMDQVTHNNYVLNKYGSYEAMYDVHHYETREIQDGNGNVILEKGLIVPQDFTFTYTDASTGTEFIASSCTDPVTNQEYEDLILEKKQTIFVLKPIYITLIEQEIRELMPYKEGSTQYVGKSLVKGDNIRLYS
tara:strand:+ start:567 stop:1238 length:672 start_codon:yes stop_codon:yes gene_type:complete